MDIFYAVDARTAARKFKFSLKSFSDASIDRNIGKIFKRIKDLSGSGSDFFCINTIVLYDEWGVHQQVPLVMFMDELFRRLRSAGYTITQTIDYESAHAIVQNEYRISWGCGF